MCVCVCVSVCVCVCACVCVYVCVWQRRGLAKNNETNTNTRTHTQTDFKFTCIFSPVSPEQHAARHMLQLARGKDQKPVRIEREARVQPPWQGLVDTALCAVDVRCHDALGNVGRDDHALPAVGLEAGGAADDVVRRNRPIGLQHASE